MKSFLHYFRNYLKESFLAPLLKLLEASFELLVPLILAGIINQLMTHSNQGNLVAMVLLLVAFAVVGVLVAVLAQYYSAKAAVGVTRELSNDLYRKVLSLPKARQDSLSAAGLLTRLSSDTLQVQTGINIFLRLFLRAPIVVFGACFMAFLIDPYLSSLFLGMVLVLFAIVIMISKVSAGIFRQMRHTLEKMVNTLQESLLGLRVIRAFGQEQREIAGFAQINQDYQIQQSRAGFWSNLLTPLTYLVVNGTLVLLIWQGRLAILDQQLEVGMLVALINYLLQILVELVKLVMVITTLNQSALSIKRIQAVFVETSEEIFASLPLKKTSEKDVTIVAQELEFTYPDGLEPALSGIHFSISKGEFFGIIGGTGSGKSSLVQLLLRLYEPSAGSLDLFREGMSPAHLAEWREQLAWVPQSATLFAGNVRTSLTMGLSSIKDQAIWQALEIAQAADFIRSKEGLETLVEAGGRNFSGGQRQRLTIARALLKKAPILILDDATSALDYVTESRLLQAIHQQLPKKTLILISQRTNSLRQADKILVLDKGQQVGIGRHDQLLETCQIYREISQSQHSKGEPS